MSQYEWREGGLMYLSDLPTYVINLRLDEPAMSLSPELVRMVLQLVGDVPSAEGK
jgi:hypothetical protein